MKRFLRLFRKSKSAITTSIENTSYVLNPHNNVLIEMNRSGSIIWKMLTKKRSQEDIVYHVYQQYEKGTVDLQTVHSDVEKFLKKLVTQGVVETFTS